MYLTSRKGSGSRDDVEGRTEVHAIRRVLVPRQQFQAVGEAIAARLSSTKVGNPRNLEVKVGPVVNKAQQASCLEGCGG